MVHRFPCDNPALDFVGTLRGRRDGSPREMLGTPASLDAWFQESGLVDAPLNSGPADVAEAVALREAIYELVWAHLNDREYDQAAVRAVNEAARVPPSVPQLTPAGRHTEATPEQALSTVARITIDVLTGPELHLLKECGRPECTQVYLDRSRGTRREWCAMETCGNKMKAAAYRARKRGNLPHPARP